MKTAEQSLRGLRDYYEMGKIKLRQPPKLTAVEQALMDRHANLNPDTQRKITNFAFTKKGYSEDELEKLIGLCEEHGYPMGFSIVERLLSIPKADRWAVQKKIVTGRWSRRDLELWIKGQYGARTRAGRHQKKFASPIALEAGISSACLKWLRQEENIERSNAEAFAKLPDATKRLYKKASKVSGARLLTG